MTTLRVALTAGTLAGLENALSHRTGPGRVRLGKVESPDKADVALFPFDLASSLHSQADRGALLDVVGDNARRGLRTILVLTHDQSGPLRLGQPDSIVLRTSMQRTMQYCAEYPAPICVHDPYEGRPFDPRTWKPTPVVGFMGYSGMGGLHRAIREVQSGAVVDGPNATSVRDVDPGDVVLRQPINVGLHIRRRAIAALRASHSVRADVVERDRYFGGFSEEERNTLRASYLRHLFASDYVLCIRGAGNYSIRLFETLAAGRIPVLVDTDLALPCADVVDWEALGIWVSLQEIDQIDRIVAKEHSDGGPDAFLSRQAAARAAYVDALSASAFAGYVARHVLNDWAGGAPA